MTSLPADRDRAEGHHRLIRSWLEEVEKLEQLKYLYHGKKMVVLKGSFDSVGVDTPSDMKRVRDLLAR